MKFKVTLAIICLLVIGAQAANSFVWFVCWGQQKDGCYGEGCAGQNGYSELGTDGCYDFTCSSYRETPDGGTWRIDHVDCYETQ